MATLTAAPITESLLPAVKALFSSKLASGTHSTTQSDTLTPLQEHNANLFSQMAIFMHSKYTSYLLSTLHGNTQITSIVDFWKEAQQNFAVHYEDEIESLAAERTLLATQVQELMKLNHSLQSDLSTTQKFLTASLKRKVTREERKGSEQTQNETEREEAKHVKAENCSDQIAVELSNRLGNSSLPVAEETKTVEISGDQCTGDTIQPQTDFYDNPLADLLAKTEPVVENGAVDETTQHSEPLNDSQSALLLLDQLLMRSNVIRDTEENNEDDARPGSDNGPLSFVADMNPHDNLGSALDSVNMTLSTAVEQMTAEEAETYYMKVKRKRPTQICPICGVAMTVPKRHMKIHSDERPHKCPKCPSSFKRRDSLMRHIRSNSCDWRLPNRQKYDDHGRPLKKREQRDDKASPETASGSKPETKS